MKPQMNLYDELPALVRRALNDALCPVSVKWLHDEMKTMRECLKTDTEIEEALVKMVQAVDSEQHNGARHVKFYMQNGRVYKPTDGVVPPAPKGFTVKAWRQRKRRM